MFKKVTEDAILPTRGSKYSACVDVYANEDVAIGAGETKLVGLGISIDEDFIKHKIATSLGYEKWFNINQINVNRERKSHLLNRLYGFLKSHYIQLMLRSSLGKKGLILPNGVGVIDLDYKDEIKMIIHNPILDIDENGVRFGVSSYSNDNVQSPKYEIKKGDKIGQLALLEHKSYLFGIESEDERNGGFGSTGER